MKAGRIALFIALAVAVISVLLLIVYQMPGRDESDIDVHRMSGDEAAQMAISSLFSTPTFAFDGLEDSIRVLEVKDVEGEYEVSISFTSRHAGYGDRAGKALPQALTDHVIIFRISQGLLKSAIIDGVWDAFNQVEI